MLNLLKTLINIPSAYPDESAIGDYLYIYLSDLGFSVTKVYMDKSRFSLLANRGVSDSKILFYGHLDTVPLPFSAYRTSGNRIYGLGSYDMKGGIAAFLTAVSDRNIPVKILLCPDEENYSAGVWSVIKKHSDFFSGIRLIISAEPNFDLGINSITNERSGRYVFAIKFIGRPVHIAKYEQGKDAIKLATDFVNRLYSQRRLIITDYSTLVQVRKFSAESVGMSICGQADLEIEALINYPGTVNRVTDYLRQLSGLPVILKSRPTPYLDPYKFSDIPYRSQIAGIIKKYSHKTLKLDSRFSVGDDNALATLNIPVITWGPDGGNAHSAGEWVNKSSLETLSTMFEQFLNQTVVK